MNAYHAALDINRKLKKELEEIYEALVGDNGMERYTHAEIIDWIYQLIDRKPYYIKKEEKPSYLDNSLLYTVEQIKEIWFRIYGEELEEDYLGFIEELEKEE